MRMVSANQPRAFGVLAELALLAAFSVILFAD